MSNITRDGEKVFINDDLVIVATNEEKEINRLKGIGFRNITVREVVLHEMHKGSKGKEVQHYCSECKEVTDTFLMTDAGYNEYTCLECATSYWD